mmetsp:Transcript_85138/g.124551  ORF Transcript_85138/g.124551 Transcript_85138/m.124551 type:complete len:86 (+) Transcript_85138:254-511(+)
MPSWELTIAARPDRCCARSLALCVTSNANCVYFKYITHHAQHHTPSHTEKTRTIFEPNDDYIVEMFKFGMQIKLPTCRAATQYFL